MRSAMIVIVPVCLVVMVGSVFGAQRTAQTVFGIVRVRPGVDYDPVAITIRLEKFDVVLDEMITRGNRFEFSNRGSGRYTIVVEAPGYETVYQDVDVPGEWFTLIELRPTQRAVVPAEVLPVWDLKIPESARRQSIPTG